MTPTPELKPCPFCGSADLKTTGDDKVVCITCLNCGAQGPNEYDSRFMWSVRWDSRHDTTLTQANERLVEALRQAEAIISYPVDTSISRDGFGIRPEKDVRYGVKLIREALSNTGEAQRATHRHVKSGGEYTLLGIGKMQAELWFEGFPSGDTATVDMQEVAIYRGKDGQMWVRPKQEFEDGRFEAIATPSTPTGEAK